MAVAMACRYGFSDMASPKGNLLVEFYYNVNNG